MKLDENRPLSVETIIVYNPLIIEAAFIRIDVPNSDASIVLTNCWNAPMQL